MPTNSESLNRELFRLLSKYKPKPLDAGGKVTPVPEEADVFKFEFTKDGEDYGTVYVTIDEDRVLTVYYGDDVSDSPDDITPGLGYDDTWWGLHDQLSAWRMTKGLKGFDTKNKDRVGDDMARRNHMRNKDKIAEGYYPMGKSRSYSDAVPSVKIVIEHSRVIEEGEQRYRNINRIFLENQDGERYLLDTKKPGIARVYARHIAEGGKVNDDRWSHIGNLCEEYQKMAGFVRATRNGQFNESAQALVNEGLEHYVSLRESLSRMTGKRGYNSYFENWTPSLMEDGTEENNLNELFVQETLDPRIESVMPILNRIHKKVSESVVDKEMNKLAEWADSLVEDESIKSNNPVGIPEGEEVDEAINTGASLKRFKDDPRGNQKIPATPAKEVDESSFDPLKHVEKKNQTPDIKAAAKLVKRGSYADRAALNKAGGVKDDRGPAGVTSMDEGSHEDQVASLAAYNEKMAGENPPIDLGLREVGNWAKVGHYGDPIKTAWFNIAKYGIRNNKFNDSVDKAMSAIGDFPDKYDLSIPEIDALYSAYETVYDQWEQSRGAANENFINQADQAVVSEEDEMAEGVLDSIKKGVAGAKQFGQDAKAAGKEAWDEVVPMLKQDWKNPIQAAMAKEGEMDEGEHTQHAMRGRNPGANEFEHDFEPEDKVGNIHDKISRMLKRLEKPKHEPNMKDTNIGNTTLDETTEPWETDDEAAEREKKESKSKDSKGSDGSEHSGHSRAKHLAKQAIPKDEVKEGQEDLDAILRIIRK
jgi:hypothetical protein